jgi:hypothetical protein
MGTFHTAWVISGNKKPAELRHERARARLRSRRVQRGGNLRRNHSRGGPMKTSLHRAATSQRQAATPQRRSRPRLNNRPHPTPLLGSAPAPSISCPDSGRCRCAGFLAHRLGTILSDAADHHRCALCPGRCDRRNRAQSRRADEDLSRSAGHHRERDGRRRHHCGWSRRPRSARRLHAQPGPKRVACHDRRDLSAPL